MPLSVADRAGSSRKWEPALSSLSSCGEPGGAAATAPGSEPHSDGGDRLAAGAGARGSEAGAAPASGSPARRGAANSKALPVRGLARLEVRRRWSCCEWQYIREVR